MTGDTGITGILTNQMVTMVTNLHCPKGWKPNFFYIILHTFMDQTTRKHSTIWPSVKTTENESTRNNGWFQTA